MIVAAAPYIIIIVTLSLLIYLVWFIEFRTTAEVKRLRKLHDELREKGIYAFAVVKNIDHIKSGGSGEVISTYINMTIEIELPDGKKYEVSDNVFLWDKSFSIDMAHASYVCKIGNRIPVIVHPIDYQVVEIDSNRLSQMVSEELNRGHENH